MSDIPVAQATQATQAVQATLSDRLPWLGRLLTRAWGRALVLLLLGMAGVLSLPPFTHWPVVGPLLFLLLPVSIAVLMRSVLYADPRRAFWYGWLWGAGYMHFGLYWMGLAFTKQSAVPAYAAAPAIVFMCSVFALFFGAAMAMVAAVPRRRIASDYSRLLLLTAAFCFTEWLRGAVLIQVPWNPVSLAWSVSTATMQGYAWLGAWGSGLLLVLGAAGLAGLSLDPKGRRSRLFALLAVAPALLMGLAGTVRLATAPDVAPLLEGPRVRIVQANIDQREKWLRDKHPEHWDRMMRMSSDGAPVADADIVIWPETAIVPYDLSRSADLRRRLTRMLKPGAILIVGGNRYRISDDDRVEAVWNTLFVLDAEGGLVDRFEKTHLVPFGEYVPFRRIFEAIGMEQLVPGGLGYTPGPGLKTIRVAGLPSFSGLICFEAIFPDRTIDRNDRPGFIVNLTNDAWFGTSIGPYQHFNMVRARAIEEGVAVLRSASTGVSAVIDPWGRVRERIPLNQAGAISTYIPERLATPPFFARIGNVVFFLILLLILLTSIFVNSYKVQH